MTTRSIRQNYFRVLSGLYELASEFSVEELEELRTSFEERGNAAHANVVKSLIEIHNTSPIGRYTESRSNNKYSISVTERRDQDFIHSSSNAEIRRENALLELLMTKEIFPTPRHIADAIAIPIQIRPKESREKYAHRVMGSYRLLSPAKKKYVMNRLTQYISDKSPKSFVSSWSALIKDL